MRVYDTREGRDNARRMTGYNETASEHKFSWGVEDRTVAVRIPIDCYLSKKVSPMFLFY